MACENEYEENVENLRKFFTLHNVVSFNMEQLVCAAGSSSGDNYMSVVKRVQISGHDCEQEAHNQSIIIKRQIPSVSRRKLYRCDDAFTNEINAYNHIVPLLESTASWSSSLFPKCYYAGQDDYGEIIVLEDLKMLGYSMKNRLAGMELNCCELVMQQLAKLHASSIAAKQLNYDTFHKKCQHIRDIVYCKDAEELYKNMLETSIQESLSSLRESNVDGCLSEPIRLIEKLQSRLFTHIQECITNAKDSLSVLCHGDLWINNIMFTGDNTLGGPLAKPSAVKFFDLQAMRYTSLVFDILHFIYTSTKRDLRDAYTKLLLETYCEALLSNLEELFGKRRHAGELLATLRNTFSLANIMAEYYEHVLYGLAISMWILPAVTFDPNNIPNLDVISELNRSAKEIKCTQKLTPEYHRRLKDLALEFYQNGYLSSYVHQLVPNEEEEAEE